MTLTEISQRHGSIFLPRDKSLIFYRKERRPKTTRYTSFILEVATKLTIIQADPALLRLPAPGLRGTWARAYALLTRLVAKIGWDELLKTRSLVFVMEEEYRMQKAQVETPGPDSIQDGGSTTIAADGSTLATRTGDADDDASTKGVRSIAGTPIHSPKVTASGSDALEADVEAVTNGIPTIRISTESNRERANSTEAAVNGASQNGVGEVSLEKPIQAAAGENSQDTNGDASTIATTQEAFSFSNKRLCERWLDNLFMVLYEVRARHLILSCNLLT